VTLHREPLSRIRGLEFRGEVHYLPTWLNRLRAKLESDDGAPALITTFLTLADGLEAPLTE
jgi:hypothetical protein